MVESICFITNRYPNVTDKTSLVFLQQLVWAIAEKGVKCTVICPIPKYIKKYSVIPAKTTETTDDGKTIDVFFPRYTSFGQRNTFFGNTAKLNARSFYNTVEKTIKENHLNPDAFYGHFISPAGVTASKLGKKYSKPSFIAYGESTTWSIDNLGADYVRKNLENLNGIISVSSKNRDDLLRLNVVDEEIITVIPNAIDPKRFYKRDKNKSRMKFGIQEDEFVVSFVGQFIERKGIQILDSVIGKFNDVFAIYAGAGPLNPTDSKTLFAGRVNPDDLAEFYSASDIFVLPTRNEGCSNAIIEAMACELPIVSSNLSFNNEILDENNSIRIDIEDGEELFEAISRLKNNQILRKKMSNASKEKAKHLSISKRAEKILNFLDEKSNR